MAGAPVLAIDRQNGIFLRAESHVRDADSVVERANAVTVRFARRSQVLPGAASGTRQSELITSIDANRAPIEDVAFVRAAKAEAARLTRSRRLKVAKRTKCGERGTAP